MAGDSMQEGKAPFSIPSIDTPCFTYYKIFGDIRNGTPPLVVLHGGPASGHEYCLPHKDLWTLYGIPVIFYDQIGCSSSTRLPQTMGDTSFWTMDLFIAELENLLEHLRINHTDGPGYDVLGHSWGGRVAAHFAARRPRGLRRLILSSTAADGTISYHGLWKLAKHISTEGQEALHEAVRKDDFTSSAYMAAVMEFMKMYLCRADPWPEVLMEGLRRRGEDPTVNRTLQGRSPFANEGELKEMSCVPLLPQISVPTLVLNGEFDTNQYETTVPFFELIPKVRWVTIAGASHMPFLDSEEFLAKTLKLVGTFLRTDETLRG